MTKKEQESTDEPGERAAPLFDTRLADQVKDSAQQIWLAGMGAFAKAQAEGRQVFETLVKEGTTLQKKTQSAAEERLGDVTSKMTHLASEATARAGQQWDRLEGIFEDRTARALQRLGVPTARDIEALQARIDELSARLDRIAETSDTPAATSTSPEDFAARTSARRTPGE